MPAYFAVKFSAAKYEGQETDRTENTQGSAVFFVDKATWFCKIA